MVRLFVAAVALLQLVPTVRAAWPVGLTCPMISDAACPNGDPLRISLLLDVSGSVNDAEWKQSVDFLDALMKRVYCARYNLPQAETELWISTWSSQYDYQPQSNPPGRHQERLALGSGWSRMEQALAGLYAVSTGGGTNPVSALKQAHTLASGSASGTRNVVVLFTDGEFGGGGSNTLKQRIKGSTAAEADRIKSLPSTSLCTVGIGNGVDEGLPALASSPDLAFSASSFETLDAVIGDLLAQLRCGSGGGLTGIATVSPTQAPTRAPTTQTASTEAPTGAPSLRRTSSPTATLLEEQEEETSPPSSSASSGRRVPGLLPLLFTVLFALSSS